MKYRDKDGILHDNVLIKGMSAYESAQLGGYDKSEEEFYKDLSDLATNEMVDEKIEDVDNKIEKFLVKTDAHNVLIFENASKSEKGIDYEINENVFKVKGRATGSLYLYSNILPAGQYTLSFEPLSNINSGCNFGYQPIDGNNTSIFGATYQHKEKTFTCDKDFRIRMAVYANENVDAHFELWLNEGDVAYPYDYQAKINLDGSKILEGSTLINIFEPNTRDKLEHLLDGISSSVKTTESLSIAEFNTRAIDEDYFNNSVHYNIFGDNIAMFHNGKFAKANTSEECLCKFALFSDMHLCNSSYNENIRKMYDKLITNINASDVDFIMQLGDNIDAGYTYTQESIEKRDIQYLEYLDLMKQSKKPVFSFGGNHDVGVETFSKYGCLDFGDVRIIKFHGDYVGLPVPEGKTQDVWSTCQVSEEQLEWIEKCLKESTAKVNIVCCHYPIAKDENLKDFIWWIKDEVTDLYGRTVNCNRSKLIEILKKYNVKMYINGHEHHWDYTKNKLTFGTVEKDDWVLTDLNQPSVQMFYTIVTVYDDSIKFDAYKTSTNELVNSEVIAI